MIDVKKLIKDQLRDTKLEILVFGPAVNPLSADPHIASLQLKRQEIKTKLISEGHSANFGEDVVDPSLPSQLADPLTQEIVAMRAADLIIVLVGSPGSLVEATAISAELELCGKTQFYCFEEHKDGLAVRHFRHMETYGATCRLVSLADVQACRLTGAVLDRVQAVQAGKAFLF
jgi:hypothetical protein